MPSTTTWRRGAVLCLVAAVTAATLTVSGRAPEPEVLAAPQVPPVTVADTVDRAAAAARRSGNRVEIAAERAEDTTVYANPDGSFVREQHLQPIRTVEDGRWVPVDPTLERNADGTVEPLASTIDVTFSGGGDTRPLATMSRMGRSLSLYWPGPLPAPVVSGRSATYPEVLPEVDLVVNADVASFSHVLVVKTPAAAARLGTVAYRVETDGLALSAERGRLIARDPATRAVVFQTPTPLMWDAGTGANPGEDPEPARQAPETAKTAPLGVALHGDQLVLTPDRGLLADPAIRYPVYLDPVWGPTKHLGGDYTVIDSGYEYNEYWQWQGAGNTENQRVGLCPSDTSVCDSSKIKRILFAIPTDTYTDPAMTILSAKFHISLKHVENTTNAWGTQLWLTGGIDSGTNWKYQPTWSSELETTTAMGTQACTTSPTQPRNITMNATYAVQQAKQNGWTTTTFGMKSNNEGSMRAMRRFCHDAYLAVQYNKVPAVPANLTSSPGGGCATGTSRPKVGSPPVLSAVLSDPDTTDGSNNPEAEPLKAQWTLNWTEGATPKQVVWPADIATGTEKPNGATFDYDLAATGGVPSLPDGTVLSWKVRAWDGTSWGPDSATCEFLLDRSRPVLGVDIDSLQYLPNDATETTSACADDVVWRDGVGSYGAFTFDALDSDVVRYRYGFDGPASIDVTTSGGAPVTINWRPGTPGDHWVEVIPSDGQWSGDPIVCHFKVKEGRAPVATWALDDAVGATQARDSRGTSHAAAGSGVRFGAIGPNGFAAAQLDGTANGYLATSTLGLLDTSRTFTVSAWAKLTSDTASQAVLSQDGTGEPGFYLSFDGSTKKWVFGMPRTDGVTLGNWGVSSAGNAQVGKWTLLVASFDPVADVMKLEVSVDGTAAAPVTAAHRSHWAAHGNIQIGRRLFRTGHGHRFQGELAELSVYDRLAPLSEISLPTAARRTGYWDFDTVNPAATKTREYAEQAASPGSETGDVKAMTLYGAELMRNTGEPQSPEDPPGYVALMGEGNLRFTAAEQDHVTSAAALVGLRTSFTVAARVRLVGACASEQVVLSQPGANRSRFLLRCANGRWELALTGADTSGSTETVVYGAAGQADYVETGQHLAVTFNAVDGTVKLYVDGQPAATASGTHPAVWNGTLDGLQVGRGKRADGTFGGYFSGDVDEVRVYAGVLSPTTVQQLAGRTVLPQL